MNEDPSERHQAKLLQEDKDRQRVAANSALHVAGHDNWVSGQ